ncbi:MAG: protein kinase, partial [Planctomycetota bacterium]
MTKAKECPPEEQLVEFLAGELGSDDAQAVESHLEICSPCNETLQGLSSSDTFDNLAIEAFAVHSSPDNGQEQQPNIDEQADRAVVQFLLDKAKSWSSSNPPRLGTTITQSETADSKAREIESNFAPSNERGIGYFGSFHIERRLGAGSSGVVYLAKDTALNRKVAIKILRPSLGDAAKTRFLTEARAAAAMDHANVVSIYQVGVEQDLAFIAMKWIPGETLATRMQSEQELSEAEIRRIASQIAAGLSAAHRVGLVHRDIKPANVWLEEETGDAIILDFGLVRAADENLSLTLTGMLAGTPSYMSPEQSRGSDIDARSDLFSLGCVTYQMLTGRLPFQGQNVLSTLQAVQNDLPAHPQDLDPAISPELSALVMSLLQKMPADRPTDATSVSHAFTTDASQWTFVPSVKQRRSNSPLKQKLWTKSAIAIVCLIALGMLGFASLFAPQIIRIATDQGQLVIETSDPDIKIKVIGSEGNVRIVDLKTKQRIDIKSGAYELKPVGDENSIEIDRETLVVRRGAKEIVRVSKAVSADHPTQHNEAADQSTIVDYSELPEPVTSMNGEHLLQPGDIVGVYIEGHLELKTYPDRTPFPAMINAYHELTSSEFDPIDVDGCRVDELSHLVRKSQLAKGKLSNSDVVFVKGLRPVPSLGYLPTIDTELIPFAPSHSSQIQEALRSEEIFKHRLVSDFGFGHPSVIAWSKKIASLKQFLKKTKERERSIIETKLRRLKNLDWRSNAPQPDAKSIAEAKKLRWELHHLIKAQF